MNSSRGQSIWGGPLLLEWYEGPTSPRCKERHVHSHF